MRLVVKFCMFFSLIPLLGSEIKEFSYKDGCKIAWSVGGVYATDTILRKVLKYPPVEVHFKEFIDLGKSTTDTVRYKNLHSKEEKRILQKSIVTSILEPSFSLYSDREVKVNIASIATYLAVAWLGWHIGESYE